MNKGKELFKKYTGYNLTKDLIDTIMGMTLLGICFGLVYISLWIFCPCG